MSFGLDQMAARLKCWGDGVTVPTRAASKLGMLKLLSATGAMSQRLLAFEPRLILPIAINKKPHHHMKKITGG